MRQIQNLLYTIQKRTIIISDISPRRVFSLMYQGNMIFKISMHINDAIYIQVSRKNITYYVII